MAEAHVGPLPDGTKPCKICQEPINRGARKCIHCQSSQGWLSGLAVSATMMSLLVALVSVLAAAVPAFKSLLTPVNSDLVFVPQGMTRETVSVLVYNRGIRPGTFRSGSVAFDGALLTLHISDLPKNEPKIVEFWKDRTGPDVFGGAAGKSVDADDLRAAHHQYRFQRRRSREFREAGLRQCDAVHLAAWTGIGAAGFPAFKSNCRRRNHRKFADQESRCLPGWRCCLVGAGHGSLCRRMEACGGSVLAGGRA